MSPYCSGSCQGRALGWVDTALSPSGALTMHQTSGPGSRDPWVTHTCISRTCSGRKGGAMALYKSGIRRAKCGGQTVHMGWSCLGQ
eukprot:11404795-Karenia_brevis.AAC.1